MILNYNYTDVVKSIVVCGDIHGEFEELVHKVCVQYRMTDTLVIVAGDCGFGFRKLSYYKMLYNCRIRSRLERRNVYIAFVRGNHDDPDYFKGDTIHFNHFRTIPDYSVISACGQQILCVGGAVSVDRVKRVACKDYWTGERPVFDHNKMIELKCEGFQIDTVVAHCAPSFCENIMPPDWVFQLAEEDPTLLEELNSDRRIMDIILQDLKVYQHPLRRWLYGHYHRSWQSSIEGVDYTMLNCMELKEISTRTRRGQVT